MGEHFKFGLAFERELSGFGSARVFSSAVACVCTPTWAEAKATMVKHGSSLPFDLILELLKSEATGLFGLR
jgi:hypothetical protein